METSKIVKIIFPWQSRVKLGVLLGVCILAGIGSGLFGFPLESYNAGTLVCQQNVLGDCERVDKANIRVFNTFLNIGFWYLSSITGIQGLRRWKS